jgi:predicted nucleic acid-binding protein
VNIRTVVVDASLAIKWVLEEPYSREAEELLKKMERGGRADCRARPPAIRGSRRLV